MAPLVYCETNWLVALAFPHHQFYGAAAKLRQDAASGRCRLRIPLAALLEARNPLNEVSGHISRNFALLRDDLARAVQNGWSNLATLAATFRVSPEIDEYARRDSFAILDSVRNDKSIALLDDMSGSLGVLHELRPKVRLQGKDIVDLYLLAAIVHDRRADRGGPAIFFSTNKKDFGRSEKVPSSIYEAEELLWRDDFDLSSALGAWSATYKGAAPAP